MTFAVPDAVVGTVHLLSNVELPAYIYGFADIRGHAGRIRPPLAGQVELYHAAKANPKPEILAALGDIGRVRSLVRRRTAHELDRTAYVG